MFRSSIRDSWTLAPCTIHGHLNGLQIIAVWKTCSTQLYVDKLIGNRMAWNSLWAHFQRMFGNLMIKELIGRTWSSTERILTLSLTPMNRTRVNIILPNYWKNIFNCYTRQCFPPQDQFGHLVMWCPRWQDDDDYDVDDDVDIDYGDDDDDRYHSDIDVLIPSSSLCSW